MTKLQINSEYRVEGTTDQVDANGNPVVLSNFQLLVRTGDALTVEQDDDATDNSQLVKTSDVIGATATVIGFADGSDGFKYEVKEADAEEVELVEEEVETKALTFKWTKVAA